ncbi:DNA-binding protein [Synergistales bacterium]|nr:DNA-binding protein [Synergistales bacterium]
MSNNTVSVAANIWDWVSCTVYLNDEQRNKLDKWKSGEKHLTFNQLEAFSKATRIPIGYFLLKTPPTEVFKILEYRTVDSVAVSNPSRELADTIRQMESIQDWMREYMLQNNSDKIAFVDSLNTSMSVADIAADIRNRLNITEKWFERSSNIDESFRLLRDKISQMGIIVMMNGTALGNTHRPLSVDEFRAFTMIDEYAPLIFINATDSSGGKLFSLLHETVHIALGANSFFNQPISNTDGVSRVETISNAAAAEILAPTPVFTERWNKMDKDAKASASIEQLMGYFKCGAVVIARRALDNGFISQDEYNAFAKEAREKYIKAKKDKTSGGNYYITAKSRIDNRFMLALESSVREGRLLFTDAYRMTNTNIDTFNKLAKEMTAGV